jgi:hypothetical protein
VTVASPCVEVTPGTLDFGVLSFSNFETDASSAALPLNVESCATAPEHLLVHGTRATGASGAEWTHAREPDIESICAAPNRFRQAILFQGGPRYLTGLPVTIGPPVEPGAGSDIEASMTMPCVGSDGAGQERRFSYIFTVVLA